MALYFASVTLTGPIDLYTALSAHYATIGATPVLGIPILLPPMPKMVAWIRMSSEDPAVNILGSSSVTPFYTGVQAVDATPVEFTGGGNRNTIALGSIVFDTGGVPAIVDVAFQII